MVINYVNMNTFFSPYTQPPIPYNPSFLLPPLTLPPDKSDGMVPDNESRFPNLAQLLYLG